MPGIAGDVASQAISDAFTMVSKLLENHNWQSETYRPALTRYMGNNCYDDDKYKNWINRKLILFLQKIYESKNSSNIRRSFEEYHRPSMETVQPLTRPTSVLWKPNSLVVLQWRVPVMVRHLDSDMPGQHIWMVTWWLLAVGRIAMDIRYRFLYGTLRRYFSTARHDASDGSCRDCRQKQ